MIEEVGITELLDEWCAGDDTALERLIPQILEELRLLARSHLRREASSHTLQPTALINEVYLRLARQLHPHFADRTEFFAFASSLMRRLLVDHFRARQTAKRGNGVALLSFDEARGFPHRRDVELLALDDALKGLEHLDPRQAKVVELRFFGGLSVLETADTLRISTATVKRDWASAKAFLLHEMEAS